MAQPHSHPNAPACPTPPAKPPRELFRHFASWSSNAAGSPWAFLLAVAFLLIWALSYPLFLKFPNPFDTWQLVINTVTTIITFLMVFLIQSTQNRDARAIHLKLDELIRANVSARNRLVELENCTDDELETLKHEFEHIRAQAREPEAVAREAGAQVEHIEEKQRLRAGKSKR